MTNPFHLVDVAEGKTYWWCSCGLSKKQPFCDGAHKTADTDLKPIKYVSDYDKSVAFCGCKKTNGVPFCDGSHSKT